MVSGEPHCVINLLFCHRCASVFQNVKRNYTHSHIEQKMPKILKNKSRPDYLQKPANRCNHFLGFGVHLWIGTFHRMGIVGTGPAGQRAPRQPQAGWPSLTLSMHPTADFGELRFRLRLASSLAQEPINTFCSHDCPAPSWHKATFSFNLMFSGIVYNT
jgi:hypothetical protein